jgi:methyltransferase FkbM-like protein
MLSVPSCVKNAILPGGKRDRTIPIGIARGIRMNLDFAHETRQFLGLYEIEVTPHLRRLARPGVTTFDVGAQDGYDALIFAKLTGAAVASFESDPAHVHGSMATNFGLNPRLGALITPVTAQVGSAAGQLGLDEWAGGRDGFVPDLIKLDIEGGEAGALRSAARVLASGPDLIVEVHSIEQEDECMEILRASGYAPQIVDQRRFFPDRRPIPHNRWLIAERPQSKRRPPSSSGSPPSGA